MDDDSARELVALFSNLIRSLEVARPEDPEILAWVQGLSSKEAGTILTLVSILQRPPREGLLVQACRVVVLLSELLPRVVATQVVDLYPDVLQDLTDRALGPLGGEDGIKPEEACASLMCVAELRKTLEASWRADVLVQVVKRTLELMQELTGDRVMDAVTVFVKTCEGGFQDAVLGAIRRNPLARLLSETLLQVINRGHAKVQAQCLALMIELLSVEGVVFANDRRILVEVVLRELPNAVEVEDELLGQGYLTCLGVLAQAGELHGPRAKQAFGICAEIAKDDSSPELLRSECRRIARIIKSSEQARVA
mmetsp:Transcript_32304/g.77459  ORF Transcript_32304/g.77459 Transcript_32304/m.77459 type:complete len:310 (+) Transcript_32304:86-1015(+)